jgi:hypothetical protein
MSNFHLNGWKYDLIQAYSLDKAIMLKGKNDTIEVEFD